MKRLLFPALLSCSLCLLMSNPIHAQAPQQAASAPATVPVNSGKATVPSSDVTFMKKAAEGGHMEVEGSTLAAEKGTSDAVKTFAKQMVTDHTAAGEELKKLASAKNVKLPERPSMAQRAKLKLLSAGPNASFDKRYADSVGVQAHTDTVKLFQQAAKNAKDADVKAFAVKTLPTLQHHLEMAKQLKATVDASSKMKSSS